MTLRFCTKRVIIKDETENGMQEFINLIGIESPGLAASPAIAKMVGRYGEQDIELMLKVVSCKQ